MAIELFEKAKELIGIVPPQYEFIYAVGTVLLFIGCVIVFLSPIIVLKGLSGK